MVGNWDEGLLDVMKTWQFVLSNNVQPSFSICTPYPGTNLWQKLLEYRYISGNIDWNNFNSATPIARTNRMSKFSISVVFILSVILQLLLSMKRGKRTKHQLSRIIAYASNLIFIWIKGRNNKWRRWKIRWTLLMRNFMILQVDISINSYITESFVLSIYHQMIGYLKNNEQG